MPSIVLSARGETHIGETKRNCAVRKAEHENVQVSQLQTGPSHRKTRNPRIHMEHCVHRVGK